MKFGNLSKIKKRKFYFDWILDNELAIGPSPNKIDDLEILKVANFKSILSLCSYEEAANPKEISEIFQFRRVLLPDHKCGRIPTITELDKALNVLEELIKYHNPVFIHCFAAMERSPLVCIAWLVKKHKLTTKEALDYVMQVHKGTNPLSEQLTVLKYLN